MQRGMEKPRPATVSEVARLIEARATAHALLQQQALEAFEHWCQLEQQVRQMEELDSTDDYVSVVRLRVERAACVVTSSLTAEADR
jgi:hypothetical protein